MSGSGISAHLVKRSFRLAGHRTSVALEPDFWAALEDQAAQHGESLAALVLRVDTDRIEGSPPLASALRLFALRAALTQHR